VNCNNPRRDRSTKPALERTALYSPAGSPKWAGNTQPSRSAKTPPFNRCKSINKDCLAISPKIYRLAAPMTTRKPQTFAFKFEQRFSGVINKSYNPTLQEVCMANLEGQKAPAFTLPGSDGKKHSLADYAGKNVILWFYPKDDTPG